MPAQPPYNEKDLLVKIAQSDEKAFHAVYQQHFSKVYAMSLKYWPDVFQAQDMVQEVFGRVWRRFFINKNFCLAMIL